jgi:hypothetical protein
MVEHNLEATVFVYRHIVTNEIRCEYLDKARYLEDSADWYHEATLEPRLWIQHNWTKVDHETSLEADQEQPLA